MKYPPIVIGKLYQYNSYTEKVLYSTDPTDVISPTGRHLSPEKMDNYHYNDSHYNMIIGEMNHGDMFVPLEAKQENVVMKVAGVNHPIPSKVFRILTTTGIIGWAYMRRNDVLEAEG